MSSSFIYITYHKEMPLPHDCNKLITMPIGVFCDDIFNEINRRNPTIGRSDLVQVRITHLYIFIYINGDRLDCELPQVSR